jgi:hypothetical protein
MDLFYFFIRKTFILNWSKILLIFFINFNLKNNIFEINKYNFIFKYLK